MMKHKQPAEQLELAEIMQQALKRPAHNRRGISLKRVAGTTFSLALLGLTIASGVLAMNPEITRVGLKKLAGQTGRAKAALHEAAKTREQSETTKREAERLKAWRQEMTNKVDRGECKVKLVIFPNGDETIGFVTNKPGGETMVATAPGVAIPASKVTLTDPPRGKT